MNNGFIKVACATPKIKVGDCEYNAKEICKLIDEVYDNGAQFVVFPELCITGYTCSDLFWQQHMLKNAKKKLVAIAKHCEDKEIVAIVGLPLVYNGKLYNVAAVVYDGEILGIVPKSYIPNYSEFYEARHFVSGKGVEGYVSFEVTKDEWSLEENCKEGFDYKIYMTENGKVDFKHNQDDFDEDDWEDDEEDDEDWDDDYDDEIPFGTNILFDCVNIENFKFAIEICEDLWVPNPPSTNYAMAGATVIANLSASDEVTGKDNYRKNLVAGQSARTISAYLYADAGEGESSTDLVFAAHNMIAENGTILAEAKRFTNETVYAEIDLEKLAAERQRMNTFTAVSDDDYEICEIDLELEEFELSREIDNTPFVPKDEEKRNKRCEEILTIQTMGLKKRLEHTNCKNAVIGISGGLDSTLALIVTVRAFDALNIDRSNIIAVTMPGFGTTDRTYNNAVELTKALGATLIEVNIKKAVKQHFSDIGHDENVKDLTYENSQARERTQILMDMASKYRGFVVGTGDLSELALGWATYNGDHMSMYGVNNSIPKTLIKYLIKYFADTTSDSNLKEILYDILDTPVSPELLPPDENGNIAQITEDVVGPYELHDFFLYNMMRLSFEPKKIFYIANIAFKNKYDKKTIYKWLRNYYWRFFSQQFKRSCLPDGPKVGSVSLSPRGDWRMPSDAVSKLWLAQMDEIEKTL